MKRGMEREWYYEVNHRLRLLMEIQELSLRELSALSGFPRDVLRSALQNKRCIFADELPALARALGVSMDTLLGLKTVR